MQISYWIDFPVPLKTKNGLSNITYKSYGHGSGEKYILTIKVTLLQFTTSLLTLWRIQVEPSSG
jgi:hypothetical protein